MTGSRSTALLYIQWGLQEPSGRRALPGDAVSGQPAGLRSVCMEETRGAGWLAPFIVECVFFRGLCSCFCDLCLSPELRNTVNTT